MYKAKDIDVDKFIAELQSMQKEAVFEHIKNNELEQVRFEQERKTLERVERMFYCSNYEKEED